MIPRVINHTKFCKAYGILIVPLWESANFYPLIHTGQHYREFVKRIMYINPFYESKASNSIFKGYTPFKSLALLIDFSV